MSHQPVSLELESVGKVYRNGTCALTSVSLRVEPGTVFGLIGPNGAGKSTLLRIASGLLRPDSGTVRCGNETTTGDPRSTAKYVGFMPDPLGVYTDLSAREYLEFYARLLYDNPGQRAASIDRTVATLELERWLSFEVETLSAGWQRRLALGRMVLADVPVLLLDEPAAGLDIEARVDLLLMIRRLASEHRTIVISSHILPELAEIATHFGILRRGAWAEVGPGRMFFTRDDLLRGFSAPTWLLRGASPVAHAEVRVLLESTGARNIRDDEAPSGTTKFHFRLEVDDDVHASRCLRVLIGAGCEIYECYREDVELNDLVRDVLGGHSPS